VAQNLVVLTRKGLQGQAKMRASIGLSRKKQSVVVMWKNPPLGVRQRGGGV
jgi:hypothetical protein